MEIPLKFIFIVLTFIFPAQTDTINTYNFLKYYVHSDCIEILKKNPLIETTEGHFCFCKMLRISE